MRASGKHFGRELVLAVAACVCLSAPGRADVPPFALDVGELVVEPDAKRSAPLPLRLEADENSPTHRIVIPAAVLAKLVDVPLRARRSASVSTARGVATGIALSLAVGCGFVAYHRGRAARIAAVLLIGVAAAGGVGALDAQAVADIPLGMRLVREPRREAAEVVTLRRGGRAILELAEGGDEAIVIVVGKKAAPAE